MTKGLSRYDKDRRTGNASSSSSRFPGPHTTGKERGNATRASPEKRVAVPREKQPKSRSIRQQIRGLQRLINHSTREEDAAKRKAAQLKIESLERHQKAREDVERTKRKRLKYRKVRFMEEAKLKKRLRRASNAHYESEEARERALNYLNEQLSYVLYFPPGEKKYVSILKSDEELSSRKRLLRKRLMEAAKQYKLESKEQLVSVKTGEEDDGDEDLDSDSEEDDDDDDGEEGAKDAFFL